MVPPNRLFQKQLQNHLEVLYLKMVLGKSLKKWSQQSVLKNDRWKDLKHVSQTTV